MKRNRAILGGLLSLLLLLGGCQKAEEERAKPVPPAPPPAAAPAGVPPSVSSSVPPAPATTVPVAAPARREGPAGERKTPAAAARGETEKPAPPPKTGETRAEAKTAREGEGPADLARVAPPAPPPAPELKLLPAAPHFELADTAGNRVRLEDHRGKTVLLLFTAVWCPPCTQIVPELLGLYERYRERGFVILSIFTMMGTEGAKVEAYVAQHRITYPALFDDGAVGKRYGIAVLPTFVLIDGKGRITKRAQFGAAKNVVAEVADALAAALD